MWHRATRLAVLSALLLASAALAQACGSSDDGAATACGPGTSSACTGTDGCTGVATCAADGSAFGGCVCEGASGCSTAADCPNGQVCDPATSKCADGVPCSTHADCGGGAYCNARTCTPSAVDSPCDTHDNCAPFGLCAGGKCSCGGDLYGAENVPANVLVVLDRSSSMNEDIGGGTKWDIARQAIADLLATWGGSIRFGLMLYPGTNESGSRGMDCGPGAVFVDPATMTASAINGVLSGAGTTSFGTPTAEALQTLVAYPGLEDPARPNYILLITDGQSTCADPVPVVASLLGEAPPIQTFVVGFGSGVDPDELDAMAQAGGTAKPQMPFYYQADDAASLGAAFGTIAGSVLSCSYTLSTKPADPGQLFVYIDGMLVPQDAADGWTYDETTNQMTFHGAACDTLGSGSVSDLVISYGCPLPEID